MGALISAPSAYESRGVVNRVMEMKEIRDFVCDARGKLEFETANKAVVADKDVRAKIAFGIYLATSY